MILRSYYERAISEYPPVKQSLTPSSQWPAWVTVGGSAEVLALHEEIFSKYGVSAGSNCLIVGVFGGRDYYHCRSLGLQVRTLDLEYLPEFDNDVAGVEDEGLPYADYSFEVIIIREVLEHVWDDTRAMANLRRLIKPAGIVIASIPFFDDDDVFHVRMHSPCTVHKLAEHTGWIVAEETDRPGVCRLPAALTRLPKLLSVFAHASLGIDLFRLYVPLWAKWENRFGKMKGLRWIRRMSSNYGMTVVLRPAPTAVSNRAIQVATFCRAESLPAG